MSDGDHPTIDDVVSVMDGLGHMPVHPEILIDALCERGHDQEQIVEAVQRGMEQGRLHIDGQGMIIHS